MIPELHRPVLGKIPLCRHCFNQVGAKSNFCDNCSTIDKRKKMCEENNEMFEKDKVGVPYICPMDCLEQKKKEL